MAIPKENEERRRRLPLSRNVNIFMTIDRINRHGIDVHRRHMEEALQLRQQLSRVHHVLRSWWRE